MTDPAAVPNRQPMPLNEPILVQRYNVAARVHHWFTALTAILLALSGLAFFHPSLFFLTILFGGPTWARFLHPWIGVIMAASFSDLFVRFWRHNIWHPDDWTWLQHLSYGGHKEEKLPEFARFNAGQKIMFWVMTLTILMLLLSGIVLWQPPTGGIFTVEQQRLAAVVHAAAALIMILNLIVHVYAAIWFRGTIRAMTRGSVTGGWAWRHHRKWFREQLRQDSMRKAAE